MARRPTVGLQPPSETASSRWPHSVYDAGDEPDPRFSFANERTMLAWLRTGLGLLVAGVSASAFLHDVPVVPRRALAVVLVLSGIVCAVAGFGRWTAAERALRRGLPLPGQRVAPAIIVLVSIAGVALLIATMWTT